MFTLFKNNDMAEDTLLNWHYPCGSDEYTVTLGEPRKLSEKVWELQARFFKEADYSKEDPWEDFNG